jgi:hypothetical protein
MFIIAAKNRAEALPFRPRPSPECRVLPSFPFTHGGGGYKNHPNVVDYNQWSVSDPSNTVRGGCEMSILPEGEQLRRAIKWISDMRLENPRASLIKLMEEASLKFDLPPKDAEFLMHFFTQESPKKSQ